MINFPDVRDTVIEWNENKSIVFFYAFLIEKSLIKIISFLCDYFVFGFTLFFSFAVLQCC